MTPSQHQLYHRQSPEKNCLGLVTELLQNEYYHYQKRLKLTNDIYNYIRSINADEGSLLPDDKAYALAKKFEAILFRKSSSFQDYSDTATLKHRLKMVATKFMCNIEKRKKAETKDEERSEKEVDPVQKLSVLLQGIEIDDELCQLAFKRKNYRENEPNEKRKKINECIYQPKCKDCGHKMRT